MNEPPAHVLLVRAIIVDEGHLLVANGELLHRPGGHVDPGESIAAALARELQEELEIDVPVTDLAFLGCVEHEWVSRSGPRLELNACFLVDGRPLRHEYGAPPSPVPTLEMSWEPLDRLHELDLRPEALVTAIPAWLGAGPAPVRWSGLAP